MLHIVVVGGDITRAAKSVTNTFEITHHSDGARHIRSTSEKVQAVVVLTKFKVVNSVQNARDFANTRNIPLLLVPSWNQIKDAVLACERLAPFTGYLAEKTSDKPDPVEEKPVAETDAGISEVELWDIYQDMAVETVRCFLKVGEKIHASELAPALSSELSLSEKDVRLLMKRMHGAGVVSNIAGETWKLLPHGGQSYEYEMDRREVPAPDPSRASAEHHGMPSRVPFVHGLPRGPYRTKREISVEMQKYKEFLWDDGSPLTPNGYLRIISQATASGAIKMAKSGLFEIDRRDDMKLTPVEAAPKTSTEPAQAPEAPKPPAPKVSDDVRFLRNMVDPIERSRTPNYIIAGVKGAMSPQKWDWAATQSILSTLRKKGVEPKASIPRDLFENDEWDALAWELLRKMPLEVVAPLLVVIYEDETITCVECEEEFLFTKGEKMFFFEHDFAPPKRCKTCKKAGVSQ